MNALGDALDLVLYPDEIRDISPLVLDETGRMRVLPAEFWASTTTQERALFGHLHGIYGFPTTELVEFLRNQIGDRSALEIGAGNGVLAEALGIRATDSFQQIQPKYRPVYEAMGQPIVPYGPNVEMLDAKLAVQRYKPDVVIGSWITHKYDRRRRRAGGNEAGVDEAAVIAKVQTYIHIGNEKVHEGKAIWDQPHRRIRAPFVYSRSCNGSDDFIAIWGKGA